MDTSLIEAPARRRRRKHTAQFKAELVKACQQPGVSSAAVALANGVNANLVRRWVNAAEQSGVAVDSPAKPKPTELQLEFVPVQLPVPSAPSMPPPDIRIELQRAGLDVTVTWPTSAAAECAGWLREVLR